MKLRPRVEADGKTTDHNRRTANGEKERSWKEENETMRRRRARSELAPYLEPTHCHVRVQSRNDAVVGAHSGMLARGPKWTL
jgi:hypothetical protein